MSIYELTQGYVNVRKLGEDLRDIVWRGLRIHPLVENKLYWHQIYKI